MQKQFDDPINHFKKVVDDMKKESSIHPPSSLDENELLKNSDSFINIGYIFIKLIYNQLNFNDFFKSKQQKLNISYKDLDANINYDELEEKILAFGKDEGFFNKINLIKKPTNREYEFEVLFS